MKPALISFHYLNPSQLTLTAPIRGIPVTPFGRTGRHRCFDFLRKSRWRGWRGAEAPCYSVNVAETFFRWGADSGSLHETFSRKVYNMNSKNSELALVKLMELFNHSSVAITKRYLGLRQEEILETYDCLTFWIFCKENIRHSHLFVKFVAIPSQ